MNREGSGDEIISPRLRPTKLRTRKTKIAFLAYAFDDSVVENKKKLVREGPLAGLWVRTANALAGGGYTSREKIRADIETDKLRPYLSVHDYGRKAHVEVITWLVAHGDMPRSEALQRFSASFGETSIPYIRAQMKRQEKRAKNRARPCV